MARWFCVKLLPSGGTRQTEIPPIFSPDGGSRRGQGSVCVTGFDLLTAQPHQIFCVLLPVNWFSLGA
jgi:hypothetical protein